VCHPQRYSILECATTSPGPSEHSRNIGICLRKRRGHVFRFALEKKNRAIHWIGRLHVPFEVLSDVDLAFVHALRLPTFETSGLTLVRRLTLVIAGQHVEKVFYPIFPPGKHAAEVIEWLRGHPGVAG
jgi:peroxiredoxin